MKIGIREVGIAILAVTAIMAYLLVSFINTLSGMSQESCSCGDVCEMVAFEIPTSFYLGMFGVVVMIFIGLLLVVKGGSLSGKVDGRQAWQARLKNLSDDEKSIYKILMDSDGTMFQSEIVEKTDWSKVKVTRTLDRLESKRLLERRRRGLTNIIVLK